LLYSSSASVKLIARSRRKVPLSVTTARLLPSGEKATSRIASSNRKLPSCLRLAKSHSFTDLSSPPLARILLSGENASVRIDDRCQLIEAKDLPGCRRSQNLIAPAPQPDTIILPSLEIAMPPTAPWGSVQVLRLFSGFFTSQSRRVLSRLPLTIRVPPGAKATAVMASVCPR